MHTKFFSENLKEQDHLEDLDINGRIIIEWILWKYSGWVWTAFMQMRIGTSDWFLQTW